MEKGGIASGVADSQIECPACKRYVEKRKVVRSLLVCPVCGHHFRVGARKRLRITCDKDSFQELFDEVQSIDALHFPGYRCV